MLIMRKPLAKARDFARYTKLSDKELREESKNITPILRLGKNGINDSVIEEISIHLKKRHLIKLKLLPALLDQYNRGEVADDISKKTSSRIILQVGGALVLFKK